jgi:hypothetical protein
MSAELRFHCLRHDRDLTRDEVHLHHWKDDMMAPSWIHTGCGENVGNGADLATRRTPEENPDGD